MLQINGQIEYLHTHTHTHTKSKTLTFIMPSYTTELI